MARRTLVIRTAVSAQARTKQTERRRDPLLGAHRLPIDVDVLDEDTGEDK